MIYNGVQQIIGIFLLNKQLNKQQAIKHIFDQNNKKILTTY